jgi:hypothetical protein
LSGVVWASELTGEVDGVVLDSNGWGKTAKCTPSGNTFEGDEMDEIVVIVVIVDTAIGPRTGDFVLRIASGIRSSMIKPIRQIRRDLPITTSCKMVDQPHL